MGTLGYHKLLLLPKFLSWVFLVISLKFGCHCAGSPRSLLGADSKCFLLCSWTNWRGEEPFPLGVLVLLSFSLQRVVWEFGDVDGKGLGLREGTWRDRCLCRSYPSGPAFLMCSPTCLMVLCHSSDKSLSVCIYQDHISNISGARGTSVILIYFYSLLHCVGISGAKL